MINFQYLYRGLCGLARAHRANPLAGHLGAAVVAGYFFGEDQPDLAEEVQVAVEGELTRIIQGEESLWYDPKAVGIAIPEIFERFPEERPLVESTASIVQALGATIGQLHESGHNVIFAAIALRVLHDHPAYATPSIVEGVRKLIDGFRAAGPGRGYYGKQRGWIAGDKVSLPDDEAVPEYRGQQAMADVVLEELIRSAPIRRQGFGGLFHVINHAAVLTELSLCGYRDLAQRGWAAHRQHVRLWRSLPDVQDELGPLKQAEHDPRTPAYWRGDGPSQWSARLTHRIKTLYGFFALLRSSTLDVAIRQKAEDKFRYLMA